MKNHPLYNKDGTPFVRNAYNYDTNAASDAAGLSCPEPTLTKQEFAEESDINYIAERYGLTGEIPEVLQLPTYGDFSGIYDFQGAQNAVIAARQQFMTLPAKIRTRFDNDPQKLLAFMDNPDNREEAEFLGLVKKPDDAPQLHPGEPATKGDGDLPPPPSKVAGDPPKDPPKKGGKDT